MSIVVRRAVAERVFEKFKGIFAIYKPSEITIEDIHAKLRYALITGINEKPCRPIESIVKIDEEQNSVYLTKNLADSPLAVGYRYIKQDFKIEYMNRLSEDASGVQICSVNDENDILKRVDNMRLIKIYEIEGRLGIATHNFTPKGRLIEKSTYGHVNKTKFDLLMSALQSTYQREMYRYFGLDLQSQEAYELAKSGLLRPKDHNTPPIIYSIRCVQYKQPFFKLEIHTINETCTFLKELVHDIGLRLKTNAICTKIRRTSDGFVNVGSTVSHINWKFDELYNNLRHLNSLAYSNLKAYNKTVLMGQTKEQELDLLQRKNSNYLIDLNEKS